MLSVRRCTGGAVSIRALRWEGWERKENLAGTSARIPCKTLLPIFMFLSQQLGSVELRIPSYAKQICFVKWSFRKCSC